MSNCTKTLGFLGIKAESLLSLLFTLLAFKYSLNVPLSRWAFLFQKNLRSFHPTYTFTAACIMGSDVFSSCDVQPRWLVRCVSSSLSLPRLSSLIPTWIRLFPPPPFPSPIHVHRGGLWNIHSYTFVYSTLVYQKKKTQTAQTIDLRKQRA